MKTLASPSSSRIPITASALLLAGLPLDAQTWNGGGVNNNWTTAANWSPAAPANNGTANITFAGSTRLTPNVDVAQDILSLTFNSSAGAFSIGGTTLTIRSGGITNNSSWAQTINAPILIPGGGGQTWKVGDGLSLGGPTLTLNAGVAIGGASFGSAAISASISGPGSLTLNGANLSLYGANTYFGNTTINFGSVVAQAPNALSGSSFFTVGTNGILRVSSGLTQAITGLNGNTNGSVILDANATLTIGTGNSYYSVFNGVVSGPANATLAVASPLAGGDVLVLGGSNTFSGTVLVSNGGTLATSASERLADGTALVVQGDGNNGPSFFSMGDNALTESNLVETVGSVTLNTDGLIYHSAAGTGTLICTTFTLNGGFFDQNVWVVNKGTFTYNAGTILGRVVNKGGFNFGGNVDVTFGNGLANFVTTTVPAGGSLTLNGVGLDNQSSLLLANSTLKGNGGLTNNNLVSGYGSIEGTGGFVNNGLVTMGGGNLNLNNTGTNANFGNIDLAAGSELVLSSPLNNGGTINVNGSAIAGTAVLNNIAGADIVGRGTISCPFNNIAGTVLRDSGTLNILQAFANNGEIQMTAAGASLAGGAIANAGTIQGVGNIGNSVANNGTIEAIGGTLTLSGTVNNGSNGLLSALSGGKVLVSSGLASQAGVINLSSGTFDNNNNPLNNTGEISGFGTFRSGGLANNGSLTFAGGLSTINGSVTNQATHRITLAHDPAIFTGTVVNNGAVKVTGTTATFAGTYIENGTFTSDPATNYFSDLRVGTSGYFLGHAGDLFSVSGDLQNGSLQNLFWDTHDAELELRGGASHTYYLAGADAGTNYSGLITNFAWGTFRLGSGESLTLLDGNGTSGGALYTKSLILEGGLAQISAVTGNGFKIYYDPAASGNAYLGGATYSLVGGGAIIPLVPPALRIVSIARLTNGNVRLDCTGTPNQSHSVRASTSLVNFVAIGSVGAGADGSFTFIDTNAPSFSSRFYRLSKP